MQETESAGGVVLNKNGEVLVVSQGGITWSLPKGHIDPGEDPLAAAKREIYEESGVKELSYVKPLGSYIRHKMDKDGGDDPVELKTISIFLFRTTETELAPVDPHNPEARWINVEHVSALLSHPKDKEFFESIRSELV